MNNSRLSVKANDVKCCSWLVSTVVIVTMSVMSKKESDGCKKLLELLPKDDLFALNDTVTNRLIRVTSSRGNLEKTC